MTTSRAFWWLLGTSTGLGIAVMLFSAVNTMVSPSAQSYAPWQSRAMSAAWVVAIVLALAAGGNLAWRKRHGR